MVGEAQLAADRHAVAAAGIDRERRILRRRDDGAAAVDRSDLAVLPDPAGVTHPVGGGFEARLDHDLPAGIDIAALLAGAAEAEARALAELAHPGRREE